MIRQIATGLVSGAIAVVVLTVTRPVVQPSAEARGRWLDARDLRGPVEAPRPTTTRATTRATTYPTFDWMGSPESVHAANARRDPVLAKLEKVMPEFRADKEDLAASLARVRDFAGVNLVVEWRALEAAGINADAPVTVSVRDLPVRRILRLILRDVGGGNINLSYAADDGVLTVSTADALWRNTVTRVYDVRDLLVMDWPGDFRGAPLEAFGIHQSHPPPPEPVATYQERMDSIVRLIQESIDPTTWRNAGGSVGGIHSFGGRLVITTTPDYHAEVEWLLGLLRQR